MWPAIQESRGQGDVVIIGHSKGDQEEAGQTMAALAVPSSPIVRLRQ